MVQRVRKSNYFYFTLNIETFLITEGQMMDLGPLIADSEAEEEPFLLPLY